MTNSDCEYLYRNKKNTSVNGHGEYGDGIFMSNAKVELIDVALKGCGGDALWITSPTSETTLAPLHPACVGLLWAVSVPLILDPCWKAIMSNEL